MSCFGGENKAIVCHVVLLDETEIAIEVKAHMKGQELLNQVFNRINLFERDYFGLRFLDHCDEARWLNPEKSVIKQNKNVSVFYFGVKFYSSDPCKLQEEITRYFFYQQLKRDILQSRLHCSFTVATRLFAYVVQAELGDFEAQRHTMGYVSEFRFLPNQSEEMEEQAEQIHKTLKNMVPADCEMEFLDKAKWLDLYGADMHHVRGDDGVDYEFGIKPSGLLVKKRGNIIGNYIWPKISRLYFKGKKFYLSVWGKHEKEDSYTFVLPRKSSCKHLWKNCVEHHAFFRLEKCNNTAPPVQNFFRFGSTHRYSGRTQHEVVQESMKRKREAPTVLRKASKKYPRRSFQEKRKATPSSQRRQAPAGSNQSPHSAHAANGSNRWSQTSAEQRMNGVARPGGLYTTGDRTPSTGSHLAKFPKPGRRSGALSGSDTEGGRRRRGTRSHVSDDEAEVRRRRHRRRRNHRGYASAGDASGTETEGANTVELQRNRTRGYYTEPEDPYDSTAQWVDSTQNVHQVSRERQGRSYDDVRSRQRPALYKSEPDIMLTPALVPVQKSNVSIARVREDRSQAQRYSGSHVPHESLYKVRSESANNKLNFKVLLELGPETGMPHESQVDGVAGNTATRRSTGESYERRYSNHRSSGGYSYRQDSYEHSPPRRHPGANGHYSSRSPPRSSTGHQFVGMKSTEL